MSEIFYHFTSSALRDGSPIPAKGEWLRFEGTPIICKQGLHASRHPFDALRFAPGSLLHRVELEGIAAEQADKVVAQARKIIATIDGMEMLRAFARSCALDVIDLWDAPSIVREYLTTVDESLRVEAERAAERAAWAAARAARAAERAAAWAAWAAARAAARATEWAARAAAEVAREAAAEAREAAWEAREAAWVATTMAQRSRFLLMVDEEFSNT